MSATPRPPFTVQILSVGGWATDITTKRLRVARDRQHWLAYSTRPVVARVVDRDGREVAA